MKAIKSLLFAGLFVSSVAMAKHHNNMPEPSKEQRAQMAEMHTKMAECLKSDKTMKDCHKEMMENCKAAKCPMMGMHKGMGKMMGKGGDKDDGGQED